MGTSLGNSRVFGSYCSVCQKIGRSGVGAGCCSGSSEDWAEGKRGVFTAAYNENFG